MLEVADILRLHGAVYRAQVGDRLLPSQARAMRDLEACRTAYFGGHRAQCDHCAQHRRPLTFPIATLVPGFSPTRDFVAAKARQESLIR